MLKWRIITALLIIPPVIFSLYVSWFNFILILSAIIFLAHREWIILSGIKNQAISIIISLLFAFTLFWISKDKLPLINLIAIYLGFLVWLLVPFYLYKIAQEKIITKTNFSFFKFIISNILLFSFALSVMQLKYWQEIYSGHYLLYILVIACTADIFAYFTGRMFGKNKICINISPKKTWTGFYGGMLASLFVAILSPLFNINIIPYPLVILFSLLAAVFSVFGDLFISVFKRQQGVKDSGHLLPGHGGILDRLDSILAAVTVFVFCFLLTTKLMA